MNNLKLSMLICAIACGWHTLRAQDKLVVYPANGHGSNWEKELSGIREITFSDTELTFIDTQGQAINTSAYQEISKIVFSLSGTSIPANQMAASLMLYPNPATDYLQVVGWDTDKKADIAIYSVNGQLLQSIHEWIGTPIPVSSLPHGLYIFKINDQSFKFRKL